MDFAVQAAKSGIGLFASQILNLTQSNDKKSENLQWENTVLNCDDKGTAPSDGLPEKKKKKNQKKGHLYDANNKTNPNLQKHMNSMPSEFK